MPAPYSYDLRVKAVNAVDRGERKINVCRTLNISRNTLDTWLKIREKTGTVAAPKKTRSGPLPKISELKVFEEFAREYGHLTQKQMAQKWSCPLSATTIGQALKKIGLTRKKKLIAIEKEMKKQGLNLLNK